MAVVLYKLLDGEMTDVTLNDDDVEQFAKNGWCDSPKAAREAAEKPKPKRRTRKTQD